MSDERVNEDKVTIVGGDHVSGSWLDGIVNRYPDYRFQARVFDVGSVFGIAQGRISKLEVWHHDRFVMHYDRGWEGPPTTRRDRKVLKEILAGFPERQHEKTEAGIGGKEPKPASRRPFRLGRARAPGFNRNRDETDYER